MRINHRAALAFSLVEVTMALGITAFCLTAVFAMLPIGLNTVNSASSQTQASNIALAIAADLRAMEPGNTTGSPYFKIGAPNGIPRDSTNAANATICTIYFAADGSVCGGAGTVSPSTAPTSPLAIYRATISATVPAKNGSSVPSGVHSPRKDPTYVSILVTWPAMADKGTAPTALPTHYSGAFRMFTALNIN